jgi:2-methylcitrate dehydratase PrpD
VHAACYLTHAAIEAVADLRKHHALVPDEVECVEVSVAPPVLDVCNIAEPKTGLEGKFSLRATTALALLGEDTADPSTFSDAKLADPRVVALRNRVQVAGVDGLLPTQSRVVLTSGGRRLEAAADTGVPATDLGAQRERLLCKFNMLAAPVLGTPGAHRLADAALGVDDADSVSELLRLARNA